MSDRLLDLPQIILPFTLAFLFLLSYAYDLDPLMVFWGVSETVRSHRILLCTRLSLRLDISRVQSQTTFRTLRIREPYVKKLLIGRSAW